MFWKNTEKFLGPWQDLKMELFVVLVRNFQALTNAKKTIAGVAGVLDSP